MLGKFHRDPNELMPDGSTPLIYAVRNGQAKMVEVLLRHHAKLEITDADGNTPQKWAIKRGDPVIMQLIDTASRSAPESPEKR